MICRKCNRQFPDTARFCPFCGEPAPGIPASDLENEDQPQPAPPSAAPGPSGGPRVKGVHVLAGAIAFFIISFAAVMLFTKVLPGKGDPNAGSLVAPGQQPAASGEPADPENAAPVATTSGSTTSGGATGAEIAPSAVAEAGSQTSGGWAGAEIAPSTIAEARPTAAASATSAPSTAPTPADPAPTAPASTTPTPADPGPQPQAPGNEDISQDPAPTGTPRPAEIGDPLSDGNWPGDVPRETEVDTLSDGSKPGSTSEDDLGKDDPANEPKTDKTKPDDSKSDTDGSTDGGKPSGGKSGTDGSTADGQPGTDGATEDGQPGTTADAQPGAAAAQPSPIPILKVERFHTEGANGFCEENYTRISLGAGTDLIFPELNEALVKYSEERIAEIETEYQDLVSFAEETQRKLSVSMAMELARADENVVSLIYGFSDYSGGAHGYYYNCGAAFDVRTGERLKLADLCTDTARLAGIIAADLYEEEPERFSAGEEALRDTIRESYLEPEDANCWVVMPEGIMFYFPPYGISYYAAGQPFTMVRFEDYPEIFNADYCTAQDEYISYYPKYGATALKMDVDSDGRQDAIHFYAYSAEVDSVYYYQDIHLLVNEEELVESTGIFREADVSLARAGGRTFLIACTDNLDDTVTTYVFDLTEGKAVRTYTGNESIFAPSPATPGCSEGLQSVRPERIFMGGEAAEYSLTDEGKIEAAGDEPAAEEPEDTSVGEG